ncbi:MAG: thymidylate kinase [Ruminococcaceae bacterium]|nr:thymidylate kinase [Oscillospiraceae bacterium]
MGKLIVLEGLDGSGKGTQTDLLCEWLRKCGRKVKKIDFPHYGSEGAALVELYLKGGLGGSPFDTNAYAASMFYAADRYVSYRKEWMADYNDPDTVIVANRYTTANAYHQLSKLDETEYKTFLDWLWDFEYGKLGLPVPDMVLLLDMPASLSEKMVDRRGAEKDIHELDKDYLEKCRNAALYVARTCRWMVIPCGDEGSDLPYPREKILGEITEVVETVFSSK